MSEILNKPPMVLKCNANWFAVDFITVERAMGEIFSLGPKTGKAPQLPVHMDFEQCADGTYDMSKILYYRPVSLEEWLELPVRSCDLSIQTAHRLIRVPTVTICPNFKEVRDQKPKFSPENVRKRDGGRCVVTKRLLGPGEGDLGHDVARAKGGKKTWTNVGYMEKGLNRRMGTKSFAEMGWQVELKEPKSSKVVITARDICHPSQIHFVN